MENKIKAIETEYNGYRFRSRLEARWAVFFDAAGIEYEYELEGFVLSDGTKYLPDFYLPQYHAFVEIKRKIIDDDERFEIEGKCALLNTDKPKNIVILCYGDPVDMEMYVFCKCWSEYEENYIQFCDSASFVEGAKWWKASYSTKTGHTAILEERHEKHEIGIVVGLESDNCFEDFEHSFLIPRCLLRSKESFLEKQRKKARQARFEYGETPKSKRR